MARFVARYVGSDSATVRLTVRPARFAIRVATRASGNDVRQCPPTSVAVGGMENGSLRHPMGFTPVRAHS
jgi:hypothetical protein